MAPVVSNSYIPKRLNSRAQQHLAFIALDSLSLGSRATSPFLFLLLPLPGAVWGGEGGLRTHLPGQASQHTLGSAFTHPLLLEGADFSFDGPKDWCLNAAALSATGIV